MLDLLLDESFVRSIFNRLAIATPLIVAVSCLGCRILCRNRCKSSSSSSSSSPASSPTSTPPSDSDSCRVPDASDQQDRNRRQRVILYLIGVSGPLIWGLWHIYEWVMDYFGFSSVRGLQVVLVIFAVCGVALGAVLGLLTRPRKRPK